MSIWSSLYVVFFDVVMINVPAATVAQFLIKEVKSHTLQN